MRVCVLMGSPRLDGNTAELCKPFIDELKLHKIGVEYITLHGKDIAPCLACYACQDAPGQYGCVQRDDMRGVVERILKADVLVFATPIYIWQSTPPMKAVMDRMYGLNKYYGSAPREVLNRGQSYALIATCGYDVTYGAGLLDEGISRWCKHSGLPYLGMYAVRDRDNLASFQTEDAVSGAREFARKLIRLAGGARHPETAGNLGVVAQVLPYIGEKYREKLTLKTVADHFFINPAYLGQQFKLKTGHSFKDHVTGLKMEKAKALLSDTNKSILEIAGELGFDNANYFSSRFSRWTGITPTEHRQLTTNNEQRTTNNEQLGLRS